MFDLKNKNALITGGASGIGKAIAETFAMAGAHVHLLELDKGKADATVQAIKASGGMASAYSCDVSSAKQMQETIKTIQTPHILVNNAGIAHIGNIENTSEKDMDLLYAVNIKGVYNGMQACIPYFKENGGGVILNIASVASKVGLVDRFAYSMTKGAVLTMTFSVAKDYLKDNIRCNCICPARIHTPFVDGFLAKNYPGREKEMFDQLAATQPIGRMGTTQEVAALALYLCSDEAAFVTGADYLLDGGFVNLNN